MNIQAGSCPDKWVFLAVQTQENFPFRTFLEFLWNLCLLLPPTHLFVSKPIIVHATNSFMSKNNVCSSVCFGFLSDQSSIIVYPCPLVHLIYVTLVGEVAESCWGCFLTICFQIHDFLNAALLELDVSSTAGFFRLSISLETTHQ